MVSSAKCKSLKLVLVLAAVELERTHGKRFACDFDDVRPPDPLVANVDEREKAAARPVTALAVEDQGAPVACVIGLRFTEPMPGRRRNQRW